MVPQRVYTSYCYCSLVIKQSHSLQFSHHSWCVWCYFFDFNSKIMNIFRKKTPKDALRTSKKEMAEATRGIEREIASLQMEEKKLVAEIKQTAKTGNEPATKILARQLVRLRQEIINLQGSRAQIRGVTTHTQALYANTSISTGMKGATKAMTAMNKEMAPAKQAKVIKDFQKQSAQLDMMVEMMSETIEETLDKDEDEAEEETEELTKQVLDEFQVNRETLGDNSIVKSAAFKAGKEGWTGEGGAGSICKGKEKID